MRISIEVSKKRSPLKYAGLIVFGTSYNEQESVLTPRHHFVQIKILFVSYNPILS